ncbi:MAG: orotate phosphoribosyltransferase [Oscillospiraceae bacterium]|jgi:orotate phosphoribosyltransferase|nr:orotate phosphoribosyltransferase [Oscillospiraceae bacterium]
MREKREFIDFMIGAGVLAFGDFVAKSGRRTPYFINTGNYKTGSHLSALGEWYAELVMDSGEEFDVLFGPAYKGITLAAGTAAALYRKYGRDVPYCFNRKEAKDHGEGGVIIGYTPRGGDRVAIIEDVVTAGTSVRESVELLRSLGDVRVTSLFVSADRMERGTGELTTLDELHGAFNINVYSIITARDIVDALPKGDPRAARIEEYLARYGAGGCA